MNRSLPPLNAMRAFEVAARYRNMSRAAEELFVTPAAVSHQIKALEAHLETKLIERRQRGFELTDAGESYALALREGFARIIEATNTVYAAQRGESLTISVSPTFGAKWLVPRLGRFAEAYPDVEVLISANDGLADFTRTSTDVGIRYGNGHYPGLFVEKLIEEEVFPVCGPTLLEGETAIRKPEDLLRHTLLHGSSSSETDETFPTWEMWLRSCGVDPSDITLGPYMSPHWMVLEAAAAGQGVALAKRTAVAGDIAMGRLVRLFDKAHSVNFAYYVVALRERADVPKIAAFREWVAREARATLEAETAVAETLATAPDREPEPAGE